MSSSQALGFDAAVTTFVGGTPNKTAVGDLDAILHFRTQDTILRDLYEQMLIDDDDENGVLDSTNQELEVMLSGATLDGNQFEGNDSINVFLSGKALREVLEALFAE